LGGRIAAIAYDDNGSLLDMPGGLTSSDRMPAAGGSSSEIGWTMASQPPHRYECIVSEPLQ
jgi:hypothetical protein